ncbi:hypothetical protein ACLKA7_005697 [Drosophila subpalustris]
MARYTAVSRDANLYHQYRLLVSGVEPILLKRYIGDGHHANRSSKWCRSKKTVFHPGLGVEGVILPPPITSESKQSAKSAADTPASVQGRREKLPQQLPNEVLLWHGALAPETFSSATTTTQDPTCQPTG